MTKRQDTARPRNRTKRSYQPKPWWSRLMTGPYLAGGIALVAVIVGLWYWQASSTSTAAADRTAAGFAVGEVTESSVGGAPAARLVAVGSPAPDLKWRLDGVDGSVSGLKGQVAVLEFFATWCPHCQAEAPILSKIAEKYAGRGVTVLGISASPFGQDQRTPGSRGDIVSYANKYGARFPQIFDKSVVGGQRFGIRGFPTTVILDKAGVVRFVQDGEIPEATLTAAIDPLLAN